MIDINAMLLCDTYKTVHNKMYDNRLTNLTSYLVPRKSMPAGQDHVVLFGVQAFVEEYMVEYFNKNFFKRDWTDLEREYRYIMDTQLGENNYAIDQVKELHGLGYLPLEIKALPEGSVLNMGVPVVSVTNTDPRFYWLTQWVECLMQSELWATCNYATIGHMYLKLAKKWYEKTADDSIDVRNAFSDFGMRGRFGVNDAVRCSASWLLSANKTSTIPALAYVDKYYDANVKINGIGQGAVSTEHSVICSRTAMGCDEETFLKKMLTELYPNTSFSFLGDSYDYWNVIDNILPRCKKEIMEHNGKLLIRPDSGDLAEICVETISKMWDMFGGSVNAKGYKVLDPHIGLILGDASTLKNLQIIWTRLEERGFAANNIIFGVGAFCFSAVFEGEKMIVNSRDTWGFALKSCYGEYRNDNGGITPIMIHKDPKTDKTNLKKSHKGMVLVTRNENGDFTVQDGYLNDNFPAESHTMELKFKDGKVCGRENNKFEQIRKRMYESKF